MVIESKIYKYHAKSKHFEFDNLAKFNNLELLRFSILLTQALKQS
jgi:hypothetical protein